MSVLWISPSDFEHLSPLAESLLMAMGAIGQPAARGHLAQTLVKAGLAPEAKAWISQPAAMAPLLETLRNRGFAYEPRSGFWALTPMAREGVCRRAHRRDRLKPLATAGQAAYGTGAVLLDALQRDLAVFRLAFYEGRTEDWLQAQERLRQTHGAALGLRDPLSLVCGEPFDANWFEQLAPSLMSHATWALLHDQVLHSQPVNGFHDWMEARSHQKSSPLGPMLEFLLLEGRLAEARALLEKLKPTQRALVPIRLLEGALLLAEGSALEASDRFESVLAELGGSGARRKVVHLPGLMDLFCILALFGRQDEAGLKLAAERIDLLTRRQAHDPMRDLAAPFQRLLAHRQGGPVRGERGDGGRGLAPFISLVTDYLCEFRIEPAQVDAELERLKGMPVGLFRRELQELARRIQGGLSSAAFPFLDLVQHSEGWEKALEALQGLVKGRSEGRPGRLAWWVYKDPDSRTPYVLEPREQRMDARGQWNRGKAISLRRLKEEGRTFDFLESRDQAVLSCIRESFKGYELDFEAALKALVGHPVVFWSESDVDACRHVEVVEGQPELRMKTRGDQLELRLHPALGEEEVLVRVDGPRRVALLIITPAHRKLAEIVGGGLCVPAKAEAQVLEALASVAPMVTVHAEGSIQAESARKAGLEQVVGDGTLQLLLMPFHQGLRAQLRVEPMEGFGFYVPGEGGATLLVEKRGQRLAVARNLRAEADAAQAVRLSLPALPLEEGDNDWIMEDPEVCMELMLELEEARDLVRVQWPEGGRLAPPKAVGGEGMRLAVRKKGAWFEAEGELTLDDGQVLSLQELLEAVRPGGSKFVQLGEGRFVALAETFRRRLEDMRALAEVKGKGVRFAETSALALEGLEQEIGTFKGDKAWENRMVSLREALSLEPELPSDFKADLRSYQMDGYRWMRRLAAADLGACLADDMGLGKTVQTLALLLSRAADGPALVLAPTSVCANWIAEAQTFAPDLKVLRFGDGDRAAMLKDLGPMDLVVCSYGLLQLEAERLQSIPWATVVLDEGQAIKNAFTKRSQAVMDLKSRFRLLLSGTPVENHLAELWNLFNFINPGLLGTLEQFRERFQEPAERGEDPAAMGRLRRLVAPFLLRRTKTEVLSELPERTEITLELEPSAEEAAFLEALRRQSLQALEGQPGQALQVLAAITRLRRACCNPRLVHPDTALTSSKLEAFMELVEELRENGHRALVFSQFVDHLGLLREALDERGITYQYLDGSTPARKRAAAVKAFQAGEGELFLISLKAGGTGLNLTAADYVIHMDPWWNPAVEDQASDRAHRMGQTRPVTVYRLVMKGSIEQKILALHAQKRQLADDLLSEAALASRMDAETLMALLREA